MRRRNRQRELAVRREQAKEVQKEESPEHNLLPPPPPPPPPPHYHRNDQHASNEPSYHKSGVVELYDPRDNSALYLHRGELAGDKRFPREMEALSRFVQIEAVELPGTPGSCGR